MRCLSLKDGTIAQAKRIVSRASTAVSESAAQEVFDEVPSEFVWDEKMSSDMTVHAGLLQQLALGKDGVLQELALGKDYLDDDKAKSASELIAHFVDLSLPLELGVLLKPSD